jgi:hypothetical protein
MVRLRNDEKSHFGMAGHFAAMSAFLLRGWNVAVPFVDVGDDVLVVEDAEAAIYRVQVKTRNGGETIDNHSRITSPSYGRLFQKKVQYHIPIKQLRTAKEVELFFMLMVRWEDRWRFILIPRDALNEIRDDFVDADRKGKRGRPPKADGDAKSSTFGFEVTWTRTGATGWAADLSQYADKWPEEFDDLNAKRSTP